MDHFDRAKDKIMMGAERRSMVMTDEEKKLTAFHEAGHALIGLSMPQSDPLHKVTIIPRGRALGITMNLPERDRLSHSVQWCISRLAMMFGGRVAEELIFGKDNVTTGASNDIMQATRLARAMVMEWGMSEKLGRVRYSGNEQEVFLGHPPAEHHRDLRGQLHHAEAVLVALRQAQGEAQRAAARDDRHLVQRI